VKKLSTIQLQNNGATGGGGGRGGEGRLTWGW